MTGILLPANSLSSDSVRTPSAVREIKHSLIQKPTQEYECGLVAVDTTVGLASAIILGVRFLYYAIRMQKDKDGELPVRVFRFSITYLMLLFLALLIDHYYIIRLDTWY